MTSPEEANRAHEWLEERQREEDRSALAIQAKLLGRLMTGCTLVKFQGPDGEFSVKLRIPSPAERRRLWGLQQDQAKAAQEGDVEALQRLDREACELLGSLCPELPAGYWRRGEGFGVDVPEKLLRVAMGIDRQEVSEIQFFRRVEAGAELRPDAKVDRNQGAQ